MGNHADRLDHMGRLDPQVVLLREPLHHPHVIDVSPVAGAATIRCGPQLDDLGAEHAVTDDTGPALVIAQDQLDVLHMRDQGAVFGAGQLILPTTRCRRFDHRQYLAADSFQSLGNVQVVKVGPSDFPLARKDRCDYLAADDQRGVVGFFFTRVPRIAIGAFGFPVIVPTEDQRATGETLPHGLGDRQQVTRIKRDSDRQRGCHVQASARGITLTHQYRLTRFRVRADQMEGTLFRHTVGPVGLVATCVFLLCREDHLQTDNLIPHVTHRH
ncbi:hypothetical protein D3C84_517990 [compost metagenome]